MQTDRPPADTAATRLATLHSYFREHPTTGPVERSAPQATPAAPINLGTVDHIRQSVTEIVEHTRGANPDAGPVPARVEAVYDWCREHTEHAPEIVRQRAEVIEYRQYLEHALRTGDHGVIRPHRCPDCGTYGLFWRPQEQRAVCVNRHCAALNGGISRAWTLARLAHEHVVTTQKCLSIRAT